MDAKKQCFELLRQYKCHRLRIKKHLVYKLPDGKRFTMQKDHQVSDSLSWNNCLHDLRIALGLSLQGREALEGKRAERKKKQRPDKTPITIDPAPVGFNFGAKIKAALAGEKPKHPEPASPSPKKEIEIVRFRRPIIRYERERHGHVRQWTKAEIEAANTALRMGKLDDYMEEYKQAKTKTSQQKESTMVSVEQMDSTIHELELGMAAALEQQKLEQTNISRLESEIEQAKQRMQAANDKHNSLNDVRTSLSVLRDDIQRIRPMLGHLAHQPDVPVWTGSRSSRPKLAELVAKVLDSADSPLRVADIHEAITHIPGCESVPRTSLYTFLTQDQKKNGDAVSERVNMGLGAPVMYWRAGRPRTQEGAA